MAASRILARNLSKLEGSTMNIRLSPTMGECFVVTVLRVFSLNEVTPGEFRKRQKLENASGK